MNGLHTTDATEQYALGLKAGRTERARGLDGDALARRLDFDRHMVIASTPTFAAFHQGRIVGLTEE